MTYFVRKAVAVLLVSFPASFLIACSSGNSNGGSGGGGTTAPTVVTPTVSSISPTKLTAGAADTALTVTGTNFTATSSVQVGSVVEPTTYVSSTELTAKVAASQLASGSSLAVIVLNGSSTSASGAAVSLEIDNPAPTISSFTPSTVLAGAASTTVAVTGTGFVPASAIQSNGASRSTAYVSGTQVNVILTAADLATGGMLTLTAVNAAPGGGTSAASSLAINNPVPVITKILPANLPTGGTTPATITLTGNNFLAGTTVQVGTTAHTASVASSSQLTFQLSVAEQATASGYIVTAVNPAPGGGTSNSAFLSVNTPTPTPAIVDVSPKTFIAGSPDTTIQVSGTGFGLNSVVEWNGSPLDAGSTFTYGNFIVATVPASLLSATGTATVAVSSPTALVPLSNSLTVSITNPPIPTLSSISPNYGPINVATSITLTGTGFAPTSTVSLNGTTLTATYNNANSLSVSVPASSLTLPGNYFFTVTTPAPGGGTSASEAFSAYVPLVSNSMVYNPVDGLLYASIPSSAGAPTGNSIVSVDPATGAMGAPIFVGSEPNKLALTADGHYLWVGLDGSSAVRKVDLVAKTAGLQFSLPAVNGGVYASPALPQSLAALPGETDSVVVLSISGNLSIAGLTIFDAGVARANTSTNTAYNSQILAIQVDGTRSEIYAGGPGAYDTFTYDAGGLTAKTAPSALATTNFVQDEIQLLSGKIFTDLGHVYDAEAGALLGTFYVTGQTIAQGATLADATLGKIFVVGSSSGNAYNGFDQIQVFKLSDYSNTGATIPVNVPSYLSSATSSLYPTRLTRWGANGLAFHTPFGIYSLESNSVADLSSTTADLSVAIKVGGSSVTGSSTLFTATVTNNGPSTASDVVLTASSPTTGMATSVTSASGTCSVANAITCSVGDITSGATATITLTILQTTAGTSTVSVMAAGSTSDSNSVNNSASASATITGSNYSLVPALSSISPAAIETSAPDTTLTVNGTGFISGSTVMLGSTSLTTSLVSPTQLTATIPAANLTSLGWAPVTVVTPAPGGGASSPLPLTIYSVITVGVNHILYDPYSRQIMASVGSGSSSVSGNSIVGIDPATATVGTAVSIGSQPTNLALSSDGQILYTILAGSQSVARYKMLAGQADFTYTVPADSSFDGGIALRGIAVQPGTEDTIALDIASFSGNAIFDFDPTNKTAAIRGQASGPYSGSCISFLGATNLLAFDIDTGFFTLDRYTITSSGLQNHNDTQSTLSHFGCFKLSGGLAFAIGGGIANPATSPATQLATLAGVISGGTSSSQAFAPDTSLQRAFYPAVNPSGYYSGNPADGITAFDLNTYLPTLTLPLNMAAIEGNNSNYSQVDIVRWGQDGLAILTSTGHIYLLRGPVVVPGLIGNSTKVATLGSSSTTSIASGSGNVLLTLTGSNFAPGVAVTWNGSYRTTTIVDQTHLTVAIPASDLTSAGTGSLVATNPGASASNTLSIAVQ